MGVGPWKIPTYIYDQFFKEFSLVTWIYNVALVGICTYKNQFEYFYFSKSLIFKLNIIMAL